MTENVPLISSKELASNARHWLIKSEPGDYSIDEFEKEQHCSWDGVRNHQANGFMRDKMRIGDKVLFYHSCSKPSGVVGLAEVHRTAHPDDTQFEKGHVHYDGSVLRSKPKWFMVGIKFCRKFDQIVSLEDMKKNSTLCNMLVIRKGQRLSVQPVAEGDYDEIVRIADEREKLSRRKGEKRVIKEIIDESISPNEKASSKKRAKLSLSALDQFAFNK